MIEIYVIEGEELDESSREIKVVKGGKVVSKKVDATRMSKRMSSKQRAALRKARRKSKTIGAKKKRKKSMKRRNRIATGMQGIATKIMTRKRAKMRHTEALINYGNDNFLLSNDDFSLRDLYGESYEIEEGMLFDIYDDGYNITADVYDYNGNIRYEGIEISPEKLYNSVRKEMLEVVYGEEFDPEINLEESELFDESGPKLNAGDRKLINSLLADLVAPKSKTEYFDAIPLKQINTVLAKRNMLLVDEAGDPWEGFITGRSGSDYFEVAYKVKNQEGRYTPIINTQLLLQWYKMPSGRYEINTYLG